jgi:para-aminobenzoate synthetase component I
VGASPELFLRADFRTRRVEMRPIKGTAPRADDPERDEALGRELRASAKDRAENVMIVDLCRNDLGRVCEPATVDVAELCGLRSHRVHHLESRVVGVLREGVSAAELLRATFPPGSVTGAPKKAAVRAIRELEPAARGIYTGAAGYFDDRGRMALHVAIRTAVSTDGMIRYHAGGGITWDSVAAREREEAGWKARDFFALFPGAR